MVSPSSFALSRASKGIPIAHETIGDAGSVSWVYAAPFRHELRELEEWFSNEESVKLRSSHDFEFFPVVRRGVYKWTKRLTRSFPVCCVLAKEILQHRREFQLIWERILSNC